MVVSFTVTLILLIVMVPELLLNIFKGVVYHTISMDLTEISVRDNSESRIEQCRKTFSCDQVNRELLVYSMQHGLL